jgi:hypothetical protein
MKMLKRTVAGEHSRELSVKVFVVERVRAEAHFYAAFRPLFRWIGR